MERILNDNKRNVEVQCGYFNCPEDLAYYNRLSSECEFISPFNEVELVLCLKETDCECVFFVLNKMHIANIVMLVLVRPIPGTDLDKIYYDVSSPYGFSGPQILENQTSSQDIKKFWNSIYSWYEINNIVSEFLRFDLTHNYLDYPGEIVKSGNCVVGEIVDEELQWTSFKPKVRNNVRKAQQNSLVCRIYSGEIDGEVLEDFFDIYLETMRRRKADDRYYFSKKLFSEFVLKNRSKVIISCVYKDDYCISVECCLIFNDSIYSFLGGTRSKYFSIRPNDYLKYNVINWARKNNISKYVLGGGKVVNDDLYKYKKSFFKYSDDVDYCTGRKIINENVYNKLLEVLPNESSQLMQGSLTGYFPEYRQNNIVEKC